MGVIPIVLGVRERIVSRRKPQESSGDVKESSCPAKGMVFIVMLVTMANGADNIGVYMPLFAGYTVLQMILVLLVFAVMIALWCVLGRKLSELRVLKMGIEKYRHILVPVVFITLGIYIILKSGVLSVG